MRHRLPRMIVAEVLLLTCAACGLATDESALPAGGGKAEQPLSGGFRGGEPLELAETWRDRARAVGLLLPTTALSPSGERSYRIQQNSDQPEHPAVCAEAGQPAIFSGQPRAVQNTCTAFLISARRIATAGHCVATDIARTFVLGFALLS